jgi:hypothetical protein
MQAKGAIAQADGPPNPAIYFNSRWLFPLITSWVLIPASQAKFRSFHRFYPAKSPLVHWSNETAQATYLAMGLRVRLKH